MKTILISLLSVITSLAFGQMGFCDNLDEAETSAAGLYGAATSASRAESEYDAASRARQAVSMAQSTVNEATDAGSYEAAESASAALDYSRKAAGASNVDAARFYSRQAAQAAASAQSAISYDKSKRNPPGVARAEDYMDTGTGDSGDSSYGSYGY